MTKCNSWKKGFILVSASRGMSPSWRSRRQQAADTGQQELRAHISTASLKQRKQTRRGREPFTLKAHAQWRISSSKTALFKSSPTAPPTGHQLPKYGVYEGHSYSKHPGNKSYSMGNPGNQSYNMGKPWSSVNGELEVES